MSERFFRVYKKFYVDEIKTHLLMYGALSGICAHCKQMDIKYDATHCPGCKTEFKFIAFQQMREHMPKVMKINQERPQVMLIDYDDFKKMEGEEKARNILG